jgi:transcriptional regulator with GAF, ATPase, and Fis domain
MVDQELLAEVLADFARNLVRGYQVTDILYTLCDSVVDVLPITGAGVMLEDADGSLRFVAATDEVVREIETLQIELGEGPCLAAYRTGEQVIVPNLADDDSFPAFATRAINAGMYGVFSFPMALEQACIGALNLYSHKPVAFDDDGRRAGQTLADVATGYVLNARQLQESAQLSAQLQHALDSRVLIEQAKGKLSEQLDVPVDEAFRVMRTHARNNGIKLRSVAADIVEDRLRLERGSP